jgi:hypothetical protein
MFSQERRCIRGGKEGKRGGEHLKSINKTSLPYIMRRVPRSTNLFSPEDGGIRFLRKVGTYVQKYTASHLRRS